MKTEQKKTAYCFLLAAILVLAAGILGVGNIRASYGNKAIWNTITHPTKPIVSNCLTSDGQVILLGELTEERQIEVWFESPVEDTAILSLESSQDAYVEAYLPVDQIALGEGRNYVYMDLIPTQLASELEVAVDVDIRMTMVTEHEMLSGTFRLTLPAKVIEPPEPDEGGGDSGDPEGGESGGGEPGTAAGQTAAVIFTFEDVFNVDGVFTVEDADAIVSQYTISVAEAGATDATIAGDRLWAIPSGAPVATDVSVVVEVTLKDDAAAGKMCTVSFTGIYGDGNGEPGNEQDVYRSEIITVKQDRGETGASESIEAYALNEIDENNEIEPQEPIIAGGFPVSTLDSFSLEGALPINMILPENTMSLTVSLAGDGLPAFTRYSVDGGESWYMLYYGGDIWVDPAQMSAFGNSQCLLLDLYRTDWDSTKLLNLSAAAYTQEGQYTGEAASEATAELFQSRTAETPLMIGVSSWLELPVPESWAECEKEFSLNHLELRDGMPIYREITDDTIRIEFSEDDVKVSVGELLPDAGTYCLTIRYKYGGICFAESEITFFVNYSV